MPNAAEQQPPDVAGAKQHLQASPEQLWQRCQGFQPTPGSDQAQALGLAAAASQQLQGAEEQQQLRQWLPAAAASLLEQGAEQDPQQLARVLQQVRWQHVSVRA